MCRRERGRCGRKNVCLLWRIFILPTKIVIKLWEIVSIRCALFGRFVAIHAPFANTLAANVYACTKHTLWLFALHHEVFHFLLLYYEYRVSHQICFKKKTRQKVNIIKFNQMKTDLWRGRWDVEHIMRRIAAYNPNGKLLLMSTQHGDIVCLHKHSIRSIHVWWRRSHEGNLLSRRTLIRDIKEAFIVLAFRFPRGYVCALLCAHQFWYGVVERVAACAYTLASPGSAHTLWFI